jgi:hypothetical protein
MGAKPFSKGKNMTGKKILIVWHMAFPFTESPIGKSKIYTARPTFLMQNFWLRPDGILII